MEKICRRGREEREFLFIYLFIPKKVFKRFPNPVLTQKEVFRGLLQGIPHFQTILYVSSPMSVPHPEFNYVDWNSFPPNLTCPCEFASKRRRRRVGGGSVVLVGEEKEEEKTGELHFCYYFLKYH